MRRMMARALASALLVLPTIAAAQDALFRPRTITTLRGCQPLLMTSGSEESGSGVWVDPCVHATVATGRHAVTGQWGVSVQWFVSLANPVPPGATFEGFLSGVVLHGSDGGQYAFGSSVPGFGSSLAMSFTDFLDVPLRHATFGSANYMMLAQSVDGLVDDRYRELEVLNSTVIPEPATLALTGGGLLLLGAAYRRRRR